LRHLLSFPAEVAILDLGLPVMDGFELARQVRAQHEAQAGAKRGERPRLIAVTGYGRDRDIAESRSAGFDVHLVKPVDIGALVSALDPAP
jgi:CheY-like chemotaxis protein